MSERAPRLAITMGDPAGVGPEIIVKACRRLLPRVEAGGLHLLDRPSVGFGGVSGAAAREP